MKCFKKKCFWCQGLRLVQVWPWFEGLSMLGMALAVVSPQRSQSYFHGGIMAHIKHVFNVMQRFFNRVDSLEILATYAQAGVPLKSTKQN